MNGYTSTNGGAGSINGTTAPVASSSALPLQPGLASAVGAQGSNGTSTPQQTYSYDHHQQDVERNYELAAYLLNTGFSNGQFADCRLEIRLASDSNQIVYMLHKLVLARSPKLLAALTEQPRSDVVLNVPDVNIDQDSLLTVIGYLYSSQARARLHLGNSRSVLAAALFLGQQDLAAQAAEMCQQSISQANDPNAILDWIRFLAPIPDPSNGGAPQFPYAHYGASLYQLLMHHLTRTLPSEFKAFATHHNNNVRQPNTTLVVPPPNKATSPASTDGSQKLITIYAILPLPVFKSIIESADFPPSDMERFAFAKKCIAERKRVQGPGSTTTETAVLAFGQDPNKASNVEIVAKGRKGRQLWKAGE